MSATSGGGGGGGSVSENSDAGESSQSTMSLRDSPSTSFQANHHTENVTSVTLNEEMSAGSHGEITGSRINLTINEKQQNDGVVNKGFDYEEGTKTGEVDFTSINGSNVKDKVPEAVNLELVNMVPYSNGNGTSYGVPVNGIPTKKDSETVDMSTPYDEYFVPVNEHKKYMRGEKLYVTKDKRRPTSWRRCLSWVIAGIVITAVLIVAILAGTGVILNQEQNMVKEASVGRNFAGANLKPLVTEKSSRKTLMPQVTEQRFSPTTDMTYLYVPKTIESELIVDNLSLDPALLNKNSTEYQDFTTMMEKKLKMILFNKEILDFGESQGYLKVINISQNPFKLIYRIGWQNKQGFNNPDDPIKIENVKNQLLESLKTNQGYIDKYHFDMEGIKVGYVINKCQMDNNGCSHICYYNYLNQLFTCTCPTNLVLDNSQKNCVEWADSSEQDYASVPEHIHHLETHYPETHHPETHHHETHSETHHHETHPETHHHETHPETHHHETHPETHHHETHPEAHHPLSPHTETSHFHDFNKSHDHDETGYINDQYETASKSESKQKQETELDSSLHYKNHDTHFVPQHTLEPTPKPSPEPSPKPVSESSTELSPEPLPEPVAKPSLESSPEPLPEPAFEPSLGNGAVQSSKSLTELSPQPTPEPTPESSLFESTKSTVDHLSKIDSDSFAKNLETIVHHGSHFHHEISTELIHKFDKDHQFSTEAGITTESISALEEKSYIDSGEKLYPVEEYVNEGRSNSYDKKILGHKGLDEELENEQNQDSRNKENLFNQEFHPSFKEESNHDFNGHFNGTHLGHGNENHDLIEKTQFEQNEDKKNPEHRDHFNKTYLGYNNENQDPTVKTQFEQNEKSKNKENPQFSQKSQPSYVEKEANLDHTDHFHGAHLEHNFGNNDSTVKTQLEQSEETQPFNKEERNYENRGEYTEQDDVNNKPRVKTQLEQNEKLDIKERPQFNQETQSSYIEKEANHETTGHFLSTHIMHNNENHNTIVEPVLETTTFIFSEINPKTNLEEANKVEERFNSNDLSQINTTSALTEDRNFKNILISSTEANLEHFAHSTHYSEEMLNNNTKTLQNENKSKSNHPAEETNSEQLENKENKVPFLEDILLRSSSWNHSISQINLTVPTQTQNWLKNIEKNSENQPIIEEIIIEKPDLKEKQMPDILSDKGKQEDNSSFEINNASIAQIKKGNVVLANDDLTNYSTVIYKALNNQNTENKKGLYETKTKDYDNHPKVVEYSGFENEVKDNNSIKLSKQDEVNKNEVVDSTDKSNTGHPHLIVDHETLTSLNPKILLPEKSQETTEFSTYEIKSNTSIQPGLDHVAATEYLKIMTDTSTNTTPQPGLDHVAATEYLKIMTDTSANTTPQPGLDHVAATENVKIMTDISTNTTPQPNLEHLNHVKIMKNFPVNKVPSLSKEEINVKDQNDSKVIEQNSYQKHFVGEHDVVTDHAKIIPTNSHQLENNKEPNLKNWNEPKEITEAVHLLKNSETEKPSDFVNIHSPSKSEIELKGSAQPENQIIHNEAIGHEFEKPVLYDKEIFSSTVKYKEGLKTFGTETEVTTITPTNSISQKVTNTNIISTEINPITENVQNHQNEEAKFTTNYSSNSKSEGTDDEEFNTLLEKDYVITNEDGNDSKEIKINKYSNKQIYLKGDKKKLNDFVKGDKFDVDTKTVYETTSPSTVLEDFNLQKHVSSSDNDFTKDLKPHYEEIVKPTQNVTVVDIPHLDNVPGLLFRNGEIDNSNLKALLTVTPDYKTENTKTYQEPEKEDFKGDFKTKIIDAKEGDFKGEKDYSKFEKDYKYDKQKGAKKKDLKKKGGVKDGKNVELSEGRKYTESLGKEESIKDEMSAQTNTKDLSEMYTSSLHENITTRTENLDFSVTVTEKSFQFNNEADVTETTKVLKNFTANFETKTTQPSLLVISHSESSVEGERPQIWSGKQSSTVPLYKIHENLPSENNYMNKSFEVLSNDRNLNNTTYNKNGNYNPYETKVKVINDSKTSENYTDNADGSKNLTYIKTAHPFIKDSLSGIHEYIKIFKPNHSTENYASAKTDSKNETELLEIVTDSIIEITTLSPKTIDGKNYLKIIQNNTEDKRRNFFVNDSVLNDSTKNIDLQSNSSPEMAVHEISQIKSPYGEKFEIADYPTESFENSTFFELPSLSSLHTDTHNRSNLGLLISDDNYYNNSHPKILVPDENKSSYNGHSFKFKNDSFSSFDDSPLSADVKPNVTYDVHTLRFENSSIISSNGNPLKAIERPNVTLISTDPRFTFSNHSYLFENGSLPYPSIVINGQKDELQNNNKFNLYNGTVFTTSFDNVFPYNKTVKNSSIYRIENNSFAGNVFNNHFVPHTLINSSGTLSYNNKTNQLTFPLKGQSGDFGNSTLYILKNITVPLQFGGVPRNSTKFTFENITESKSFSTPKNITSQINSNNSSPFTSLTPNSFSLGTAYQINDYFGYISKCASGQFQCINGTSKKGSPCINLSSKCDSINDCSDGSDEIGCIENGCPGNFQCSDGTCLKRHLVCNGIIDCDDGSDETECEKRKCKFDELRCPSGKCIPIIWKCDGKADCDNHTDEMNCQLPCGNDEFMCPEGWCIPLTYKCNGIKECSEGEDERFCDCSHEEFKCEAGGCVSKNKVCNGIDDCPDRSDEWNCFKLEENSERLLIRNLSGEYQPVCSDNWTIDRSNEVCASLGYSASVAVDDERSSTISTEKSFYALKNDSTEVNINNLLFNLVKTNSCSSGKLVQISCQEFTCGSRSMTNGSHFDTSLIREMTASAGQWPSVALLHNVRNFFSCTANILTPRWVLSSYNCLKGNSKNVNRQDWKLFSGLNVFEAEKETKENREIIRIIPHPQIKFNQFLFSNDLALVELDKPVQFSANIGAVCLPEEEIQPRQICVTAGWGISNSTDKKVRQQIQYLPVGTMNLQECNSTEHYSGFITDDKICAGYNAAEKSLCYNEEGAPLMCVNDRGEWEVQGVLSYHSNCGRGSHPSIFSSIMPVKKWIKETIGNRFERKVMVIKR